MSDHRILIIDSDNSTLKFLGFKIQEDGYTVYTKGNAKEGLIAAFQYRPHIIIIDPKTNDIPLHEFIRKIKKDRRTNRCKLIAITSTAGPMGKEEFSSLGFDFFLPKGGDVLPNLKNVIQKAINDFTDKGESKERLTSQEETIDIIKKDGKIIVFLSAKGGTGTSSICANLAHIMNENKNLQLAVVDLVLPIGSISSIVNQDTHINIVDVAVMQNAAITPIFFIESLIQLDNWNFQLLAGSPDPKQANNLDASRVPVILNTMRQAFDYIFIDLGKSLSRISLPIIQSSDQIVIILSLDEATAKLTYSVWKFLQANGVKKEQVYMLINRAVGLEGFSKSEVEEQLGVFIPNTIPYMSRNMTLANNQHLPILHKFPDDTVTIAMRQTAREIQERLENKNKSFY
ncbi:MAG: AAA family ATPase [Anaerolineales bacterium]